jgi:hypothetical protein
MFSFRQSDREAIARDALSSEGKSPQERMAMFVSLMATVDAITRSQSPEERVLRLRIAERLDPLPDPWWKNFRQEALAEYRCQTSSK